MHRFNFLLVIAFLSLCVGNFCGFCGEGDNKETFRQRAERATDVIAVKVTSAPTQVSSATSYGQTVSFSADVKKVIKGCVVLDSKVTVHMIQPENPPSTTSACPVMDLGFSTFKKGTLTAISAPVKDQFVVITGCHSRGNTVLFYVDPCGVFDQLESQDALTTLPNWSFLKFVNDCQAAASTCKINHPSTTPIHVHKKCDSVVTPELLSNQKATRVAALKDCFKVIARDRSAITYEENKKKKLDKVFSVCHTVKCGNLLGKNKQQVYDYVVGFQMRRESTAGYYTLHNFAKSVKGTIDNAVATLAKNVAQTNFDLLDIDAAWKKLQDKDRKDLTTELAYRAASFSKIYFKEDFLGTLVANALGTVNNGYSAEYKLGAQHADGLPKIGTQAAVSVAAGHLFSTTGGFGVYMISEASKVQSHMSKDNNHDIIVCMTDAQTKFLDAADRDVRANLEAARMWKAKEYDSEKAELLNWRTSPQEHNQLVAPDAVDEALRGYVLVFKQSHIYMKEEMVFDYSDNKICRKVRVGDYTDCDGLYHLLANDYYKELSGGPFFKDRIKAETGFKTDLQTAWQTCASATNGDRFCDVDILKVLSQDVMISLETSPVAIRCKNSQNIASVAVMGQRTA